jgi:hypothetical protein
VESKEGILLDGIKKDWFVRDGFNEGIRKRYCNYLETIKRVDSKEYFLYTFFGCGCVLCTCVGFYLYFVFGFFLFF